MGKLEFENYRTLHKLNFENTLVKTTELFQQCEANLKYIDEIYTKALAKDTRIKKLKTVLDVKKMSQGIDFKSAIIDGARPVFGAVAK